MAAATIRSFSARDQRRRRCTDVITSTCVLVIVLVLVVVLGLDEKKHTFARRPSPDACDFTPTRPIASTCRSSLRCVEATHGSTSNGCAAHPRIAASRRGWSRGRHIHL